MLDNVQQIIIFTTVGTEQNFTRAAERLSISKSQVSKQVRLLEDSLGCQLLQRSTRTVALTEIGQHYYEYGLKIIDSLDEANAMIAGFRNEVKGVLRIGIAQSFGTKNITGLLNKFKFAYPGLELEISLFDRRPNLIEEGFDCWLAIHEKPPEGMVAKKLGDCQFVVVASPAYIEKHGKPHHPTELRKHNCITYQSYDRKYNIWEFKNDDQPVSVRVTGNYRIDNAPAVLEAAKAGIGIGYIATNLIGDEIATQQLITLLPEWETVLPLPINIVYPRRKHLAPKVRAFIDFMEEMLVK